ncbi:HamA C-terminal domain-containing protein [Bacillus cereus]|uniref:HamA C-terminal domain-containing protein n=1 Tax=Bacillus cereus TaxID=1396 RepID=UPI0035CAA523
MSVPVQSTQVGDFLESYIKNLIRGNGKELNAYLKQVSSDQQVVGTKAITRCFMISPDAQHLPRVEDLALKVAYFLLDYAIPRSEIEKAKLEDEKFNTTENTVKLKRKAKKLFSKITNTGEGGELLLYLLIQGVLKIPQALCKMSLKTSGQVHYHGADAIHLGLDNSSNKLLLYWGESKLYQSVDSAIRSCFESIAPYLIGPSGNENPRERDLQLLMTNLDLANKELEDAILCYLDPDHPYFNSLEYRGACLIGFDVDNYCVEPFAKNPEIVLDEINQSITSWIGKVNKGIQKHSHLDKFTLDVFLIPFPSVQVFRDAFLEAIRDV